jgi:hypothetical protein
VAEHANAAVLVTLGPGGAPLDRRDARLTEDGLSSHPHHHEGSWAVGRYLDSPWARRVSLEEAVALVEKVHKSAARGARRALKELSESVAVPIAAIALRACPALPATIEARIRDNRAQAVADSVMYRQALAAAAEARGWRVHWYAPDEVLRGRAAKLASIGRELGAPWQAKQKLAAAAALAAQLKSST